MTDTIILPFSLDQFLAGVDLFVLAGMTIPSLLLLAFVFGALVDLKLGSPLARRLAAAKERRRATRIRRLLETP